MGGWSTLLLSEALLVYQWNVSRPLPWVLFNTDCGTLKLTIAFVASYCASKGAVIMLTRQVALDYAADKIHVNAVCPGFLKTAMVRSALEDEDLNKQIHGSSPWPHLGTPEDVGKAVLFLCSDAASWTTGSILNVDGGYCAQ